MRKVFAAKRGVLQGKAKKGARAEIFSGGGRKGLNAIFETERRYGG